MFAAKLRLKWKPEFANALLKYRNSGFHSELSLK